MPQSPTRLQDEQMDFSGGINSQVVTTIASQRNPNGLKRNQSAWLTNATCRGGGILPRTGWNYLLTISDGSKPYEFGSMYDQFSGNPYLMVQIGGHLLQIRVDTDNSIHDLSTQFNLVNPTPVPRCFFAQASAAKTNYLIIQPGDFGLVPHPTNPLFWDGTTLRRSHGITGNLSGPNINEIPPATCMVYYMNRLWYAQDHIYSAGDIDQGSTTILNVTENPLAIGGDGFAVPSSSGTIRALAYTASLDTALGQGPLFIFTRKQVYQLIVPVTRSDWIGSTASNMPLQTIAQITNGAVNDTSVVPINGDLFYQSLDPAIRSLISAIRYYDQWGNVPISRNENRLLQENDRSLLRFASGIEFDNRVLQTAHPVLTSVGTVHQAIAPLDFDIISSLEERLPPVWEGAYEGLNILQLFTGDFGGLQRAFATVVSQKGTIDLWELTNFAQFDNNTFGESRITWVVETPAFTCNDENQFKELDTCHFWFDRIFGNVVVQVQYREDGNNCWHDWAKFKMCAARNSAEAGEPSYPLMEFCETDQRPVVLPKAPQFDCNSANQRPVNLGYQFQIKLTIKGFCRLRSIRMFCFPKDRQPYQGMIC